MNMKIELKYLINKKVVEVEGNSIRFEDGTVIDFHPYETYVYKPDNEEGGV